MAIFAEVTEVTDTGVARILSGGALFCQKSDDLSFFSRRPQRLSKYTSKSSKNYPKKLTLALAGGALRVPGGALTHFSCKLGLKKFFHRAGALTAPPGYAYGY